MNKFKKLSCYRRLIIKTLLQLSGLYVFPIFKYLSQYFAQIYRAQYGAAMLVYLQGTPTLGARGFFFFRSEMSGEAAIVILPREKKKSLWTRQLQTSLPCDFETKHLTKPVFEGSVDMSARVATMREHGMKLSSRI